MSPSLAARASPRRAALALVAVLLLAFAAVAWAAVRGSSPTVDETVHAAAALAYDRTGDLRVNPEHPPLWKYWAGLAVRGGPFPLETSSQAWAAMPRQVSAEWDWSVDLLYHDHNDADALVRRCRAMMLVIGVGLGAAVAAWAWQRRGPVAGAVAAALFCLDPNFLAHAPLVTNDLAVSLAYLGTAWALWRVGRRATLWNAAAAALCCAAAVCTKSVGLLAVPAAVMLLGARAVLSGEWVAFGRRLRTRPRRALAAAGIAAGSAVVVYVCVWAAYGFRFAPTPSGELFADRSLLTSAREQSLLAEHPNARTTAAERAAWAPPASVQLVLWAERHRLLPQAYLAGTLFNYANSRAQPAFLCGSYGLTGWWCYFPLALLFKSSAAALVGAFAAAGWAVVGGARNVSGTRDRLIESSRRAVPPDEPSRSEQTWSTLSLAIPVVVYALAATSTAMNIGVRHVFPVVALLDVGVACAAASLASARPRTARWLIPSLAAAAALEAALTFPNYLSFFNAPSGGPRGGLSLLSDSNLDWGQDLKRLAAWQRNHPDQTLYLSYFGSADPLFYGIRYINLPGGYARNDLPVSYPTDPGVLAISATELQGTYYGNALPLRQFYADLQRTSRPREVIGGSIYLYDYRPAGSR